MKVLICIGVWNNFKKSLKPWSQLWNRVWSDVFQNKHKYYLNVINHDLETVVFITHALCNTLNINVVQHRVHGFNLADFSCISSGLFNNKWTSKFKSGWKNHARNRSNGRRYFSETEGKWFELQSPRGGITLLSLPYAKSIRDCEWWKC